MTCRKIPVRRAAPAHPNEAGMAMILTLFTLTTLMIAIASALVVGSADVAATRNYRDALEAHMVAESAIYEALQLINGPGVTNFKHDVADGWSGTYGGTRNFAPVSGFEYVVTAAPDATDPANKGVLIATATRYRDGVVHVAGNGNMNATNRVVATVVRAMAPPGGSSGGSGGSSGSSGGPGSPGAVYLANDNPVSAEFDGVALVNNLLAPGNMFIDGNDHTLAGGAGTAAPVPGISTRNDTNTQTVRDDIPANLRGQVRGQGYYAGPPIQPSVLTSPAAPSVAQINVFVDDWLSSPSRQDVTIPTLNCIVSALLPHPCQYGTDSSPQVTHFTGLGSAGLLTVQGQMTGAGIMIVEGDMAILGNFSFDGLVIVRGAVIIDSLSVLPGLGPAVPVLGNMVVRGSLWTEKVTFKANGGVQVLYSSQGLQLANAVPPPGGGSSGGGGSGGGGSGTPPWTLPSSLQVTSLADCSSVPAGSGGC